MGGSSGSSTSTYSPPPEVAAAYKQLLSNAQPLFTAPYQPYTAGKAETASEMVPLTVAPQTPNQVAAGQNIASLAGYYQPYANAATDLVQQGSQPIQLQQFNNQSVGQYMSPFMQNVMGSTVANINETNAQQQQQVLGNAIAKGAYGGDRAGIAQSELARQQNLANNATLANIANTGYNSALGQFNAMNQQGLQAQLGSGQLAQSGAGLLGNLGTAAQNAALNQAQAQYGVGSQQQQQKQAELSTAYQNYMNQIGYPYQQAQFEGGLISGVASGMGGTSTSTPAQPSGMNQAIGGIGALASLGNAGFFGSAAEGTGLMGFLASAAPAAAILASGGRVHSPENKGYASGGEVQQKELMGVSPIAGISATSYIPTAQMQMANPHMPQAPQTKDPNSDFYSNLAGAVKSVKSMMGKKDSESDTPPEGAVAPISSEASLLEAAGGRIHHYGVGGVADTHPDANITAASPHHSDSFDALKASQQHYTQSLPNAGVVPTPSASTGVTGGSPIDANGPALHNPALARSNYTNLATSGKASLADLQSAYDLYMHSHATPEAITPVQLGSGTPATTDAASSDNSGSSGPEGGGGGGSLASGGRIYAHHFGSGGGIVNYAGMPTSKTIKDSAEESFGSGQAGSDATVAALAAEDFLPGKSYGGVIGREHHAGPDDTNGQSNVVGKAAGVAAVAPEEGVATGVPRQNYGNFHPEFATRFEQFVKRANEEGIPIKPGSGFRDANEQAAIYADKQAGNRGSIQHLPVAPPYASGHQYGLASDFSGAKPSHYGRLGEIATEVGLNYGGKFGDPIHVQYGPNSFSELRQHAYDENGKFKPGFALPQDWADRSKEAANAPYPAGLVGAKPSGVVQGAAPQGQSQGQEQSRQGPMQLNQTATKEGLSGMLGISMTDNQRLAAFNAFAKLAGTPGKFGVGLAAAADTYSKTLMEANKQQREGYTAESEAKLRAEQATSQRVKQEGMTTQVRKTDPVTGAVTVENQIIPPGQTATFAGQGQSGSGSSTATGAPSAPSAPQTPKEINLLGPVAAGEDGTAKFDTLQKLADEAVKTYSAIPGEAQKMYLSKSAELYDNQKAANASRPDLKAAIQSVSEMGGGGLTGAGPGSEYRTAIANYINLGLRSFGVEGGINERDIANKQVLDKLATIQANQGQGSNAARWLESVKNAYPQTELTEQAAKNLTASLMVTNTMHNDMGNFANEYGKRTYSMGHNVTQAFNQVNPANLYSQAKDDIARLMIERNGTIPTKDGRSVRGNPVSALAMGVMTPEEFNDYARRNGSKISNLARFVTGGE